MAYKIVPRASSTNKNTEKESWIGWGARNIAGGLKKSVDYLAQGGPLQSMTMSTLGTSGPRPQDINIPEGHKLISNPRQKWLDALPQEYTSGKGQPLEYVLGLKPGYLSGKNVDEEYLQHLISTVGITGAHGGLKPVGNKLTEKVASIGKKSLGTVGNVIASDVTRGTAKALGAPDVVSTALGATAPGVVKSLTKKATQEHFQPIKKDLYDKVKSEGENKIDAGQIKELTKDFLEIEQRRTGGKSPFIRRLANWNKESSNNEIKAEDLHNIKKDLNQYIYKEYNSPDYLKALEKEVHKQIDAAGKNGQRTQTNLTLPNWSNNLKKADKLHSILTEGDFDQSPEIIKWLFKKFTPGKYITAAGKQFVTPIKLWWNLPEETKDFYVKNIIEGIEKNPGIFQPEIKQLNKLTESKQEKKKGFKIIPRVA